MPNNCLSVLYIHIIQVENNNVGLKVCVCGGGGGEGGGHKHTIAPNQKSGVHMPPIAPTPHPASYASGNVKPQLTFHDTHVGRSIANLKIIDT